jgi:uncharacterized protein
VNQYKPINSTDKESFDRYFAAEQPETSELTFTNLFIWRDLYRPLWSESDDCLLLILNPEEQPAFGLPPVGNGNKQKALDRLCDDMVQRGAPPLICRVGKTFVNKHLDTERYEAVPDRDNSDYVYLAQNLIQLSGNKYHGKKNHVNRFVKNHLFEYRPLDAPLAKLFLDLQDSWCEYRSCEEDPALAAENKAVIEALRHFNILRFQGGAILTDGKVEAFALGEMLNSDTAVIHIEKANPEIPGLYAAINQLYCKETWSHVKYVNREQDLGLEGLRKAKLSYHPAYLVEKFTLTPK